MDERDRSGQPDPAELLNAPERALELPVPEAAVLLARIGALEAILRARLGAVRTEPSRLEPVVALDRLLTADEAARRLGMSKRWLYANASTLPFARRLSGRAVRFSERDLERWQTRRKA
jgi:excisionase family DNA binding protein